MEKKNEYSRHVTMNINLQFLPLLPLIDIDNDLQ